MVDVSLVSLPPSVLQSAQPSAAADSVGTHDLGPLASLPVGSTLAGFVLNRDAKGNPILRTASGDFLLKTPFFLKIGSDVTLRVNAGGANFRASLVAVDGLPPEQAAILPAHAETTDVIDAHATPAQPQVAQEETPSPQQQQTQTATTATNQPQTLALTQEATPQTPLRTGTLLQATLTDPPAAQPANGANVPQPGSTLSLRVLSAATPAPQEQTPAQPAAVQTPTRNTTEAQLPPATTSTPQPETPQPAYSIYTRPITLTPAQAQSLQILPQANGNTALQALVVSVSPEGEAVAATPFGMLQLQGKALPVGSTLLLEVLSSAQAPTISFPPPVAVADLAAQWPALQQIVSLVQNAPAETLPETLQLPTAPLPQQADAPAQSPIAATLMQNVGSFIAALQTGDVRSLLGERVVRLLQNTGHADLLQKASVELSDARSFFFSPPPQQWQALFVPLLVEGQVRPVRFFIKREKAKEPNRQRQSPADTRFVVETELSQLGGLQLDGFLKKRDNGIQFDLILRTHATLSAQMRQDIVDIYNTSGEITGYHGMLIFQETADFPVRPLDDIMAERHRAITV